MVVGFSVLMWSCGGTNGSDKSTDTAEEFKIQEKDNYEPGEYAAQQVLLAYVTKDVELLKEYASSLMRMALDDDAMDRPDFIEQLNSWDGAIKEIRYKSDIITFEEVYYAYGYYEKDKKDADKIYVVVLESKDKLNWVITVNPLRSMSKSDFEEKSITIFE